MVYLIVDNKTNQVIKSTATQPAEISNDAYVVIDRTEGFEEGVEIEKLIIVHGFLEEDGLKFLTNYSAMKQSAKAQEIMLRLNQLQNENDTLKADNEQLKNLVADLTEVVLMGV